MNINTFLYWFQYSVILSLYSNSFFWLVCKNTWIHLSPPVAFPCVTSPTLPSGLVKTHCFKERLHGFLSPTLLKDGSLPDNVSSSPQWQGGRWSSECSFNLCFFLAVAKALLDQRNLTSHDWSDSLRFFFSYKKKKNCICFLPFVACARRDILLASWIVQFTVLQKYYLLIRGNSNS